MNHPTDPRAGLPDGWSGSAKATYAKIAAEHPNMSAAATATLYEACALIAAADAMQAAVDAEGLVVKGSASQPVAHPLIPEVRQARTQALAALRAMGLGVGQSGASRAASALVSQRHHKNRSPEARA